MPKSLHKLDRIEKNLRRTHGRAFTKHLPRIDKIHYSISDEDLIIDTQDGRVELPANHRQKSHIAWDRCLTKREISVRAQPGPQRQFLACRADFALFGGAAGGGKSQALLSEALRGCGDPNFSAVLLRRTHPELSQPGGLIDRSASIYSPLNIGNYNSTQKTWHFPSGAKIAFKQLQHEKDKHKYQGAEISLIGFDELTHFTETQWEYLTSRSRSPLSWFNSYVRASTNPDADSWIAKLIEWWIDQETGFPLQERSGVVRWFVNIDGEKVWANDPDDLQYTDSLGRRIEPKSFTFIPAKLSDNPALLNGDPSYLGTLQALHPVERARLLDGNWKVRLSAGKFFQREWFQPTDAYPENLQKVRFWDIAATDAEVSAQACYTAGVLLGFNGSQYWVLDAIAEQYAPEKVADLMLKTAHEDGHNVKVRWEKQPAAAGKFLDKQLIELLHEFDATWWQVKGSKTQRAIPFATAAHKGDVFVLNQPWQDRFLNWCVQFPDNGKDIVDAASGAFNILTKQYTAIKPTLTTPIVDAWGRFH